MDGDMNNVNEAKKKRNILQVLNDDFEQIFSMICFVVIAVIMMIQVFCRYVLNASLSWSEELCIFMLIWMGLLSSSYCIRKRTSIKVEMIVDLFPPVVRKIVAIIEHLIMIAFNGYMIIPAWQFLYGVIQSGQFSTAMQLPMYFVQSAPLVAFALSFVRSIQRLIEDIKTPAAELKKQEA